MPGQDPDIADVPSEPPGPPEAEQDTGQESPEKLDRKEKKILKKKSPFLPGNSHVLPCLDVGGTLRGLQKHALFLLLMVMFVGHCQYLPNSICLAFKIKSHEINV